MAANEAGAIQGCRTIGSAEAAYSAVNNQSYASLTDLVDGKFIDSRFSAGFNGYTYEDASDVTDATEFDATIKSFLASPATGGSTGRYLYGIGADQVVRYMGEDGTDTPAKCGGDSCAAGDPIGISKEAAE
jgi:hypothetical protein